MTSHPTLPTWRRGGLRFSAVLCLAALLTALGCGTSAYQERFDAALKERRDRSKEVENSYDASTQLQDQPQLISADWPSLTLRRPIALCESPGRAFVAGDPHPLESGGTIAPGRLNPPFMAAAESQLPGFIRCWESFTGEEDEERTPYYMYVAVVPAAQAAPAVEGETDGTAEETAVVGNSPADEIHARVAAGLGVDPGDWKPIEWDDEPAVLLKWKRLSVETDQEFLIYKSDQEPAVAETLPGRFDVCFYEGAKYHVIIAWRVPLERGVEAEFDLDKIQKACLGTLQGAD